MDITADYRGKTPAGADVLHIIKESRGERVNCLLVVRDAGEPDLIAVTDWLGKQQRFYVGDELIVLERNGQCRYRMSDLAIIWVGVLDVPP